MDYSQHLTRSGGWAKAEDLKEGTKAKILDEATRIQSQFKDEKTGEPQMQDVCKIRFQGMAEPVNVRLNRATIGGLVSAFGSESRNWIDKVLTVHKERMTVANKRRVALYLVPDGYEVGEDDAGYVVIGRQGTTKSTSAADDALDAAFEDDVEEVTVNNSGDEAFD